MIKHGPVDVVVLAAGEPKLDGSIFAELQRLAGIGLIRVLDAMLLLKDQDGNCWRVDLEDLPQEMQSSVAFIDTGTRGMFDSDDAGVFFEGMVPGSGVVALAIEHVWAIDLVNTVYNAGVELAFQYRVPAAEIEEAFASLEVEE